MNEYRVVFIHKKTGNIGHVTYVEAPNNAEAVKEASTQHPRFSKSYTPLATLHREHRAHEAEVLNEGRAWNSEQHSLFAGDDDAEEGKGSE